MEPSISPRDNYHIETQATPAPQDVGKIQNPHSEEPHSTKISQVGHGAVAKQKHTADGDGSGTVSMQFGGSSKSMFRQYADASASISPRSVKKERRLSVDETRVMDKLFMGPGLPKSETKKAFRDASFATNCKEIYTLKVQARKEGDPSKETQANQMIEKMRSESPSEAQTKVLDAFTKFEPDVRARAPESKSEGGSETSALPAKFTSDLDRFSQLAGLPKRTRAESNEMSKLSMSLMKRAMETKDPDQQKAMHDAIGKSVPSSPNISPRSSPRMERASKARVGSGEGISQAEKAGKVENAVPAPQATPIRWGPRLEAYREAKGLYSQVQQGMAEGNPNVTRELLNLASKHLMLAEKNVEQFMDAPGVSDEMKSNMQQQFEAAQKSQEVGQPGRREQTGKTQLENAVGELSAKYRSQALNMKRSAGQLSDEGFIKLYGDKATVTVKGRFTKDKAKSELQTIALKEQIRLNIRTFGTVFKDAASIDEKIADEAEKINAKLASASNDNEKQQAIKELAELFGPKSELMQQSKAAYEKCQKFANIAGTHGPRLEQVGAWAVGKEKEKWAQDLGPTIENINKNDEDIYHGEMKVGRNYIRNMLEGVEVSDFQAIGAKQKLVGELAAGSNRSIQSVIAEGGDAQQLLTKRSTTVEGLIGAIQNSAYAEFVPKDPDLKQVAIMKDGTKAQTDSGYIKWGDVLLTAAKAPSEQRKAILEQYGPPPEALTNFLATSDEVLSNVKGLADSMLNLKEMGLALNGTEQQQLSIVPDQPKR